MWWGGESRGLGRIDECRFPFKKVWFLRDVLGCVRTGRLEQRVYQDPISEVNGVDKDWIENYSILTRLKSKTWNKEETVLTSKGYFE